MLTPLAAIGLLAVLIEAHRVGDIDAHDTDHATWWTACRLPNPVLLAMRHDPQVVAVYLEHHHELPVDYSTVRTDRGWLVKLRVTPELLSALTTINPEANP